VLDYNAPLRDIRFIMDELLDSHSHYPRLRGCEEVSPELAEAIIDGAARFAEQVVAPLRMSSDEQGCRFEGGTVVTPDGFKEAFRQYGEGGWPGLNVPAKDGGQGLPASLGLVVSELIGSGNWAWSMYSGLAQAPVSCLLNGGSDEQKQTYLPKLLSGEWAGTMCLTEAHCGSDVGLLRTKAVKADDGSYRVSGTKIFVSGGEQDLTQNIIHTVLARVEGAPAGTKGVSLFLIPKILLTPDGSPGERNAVECVSIEKKMGLKGSATCVMQFDDATAFLLGEQDRGLAVMFKLMNTARLGTALQGVALGELAFQGALAYARERLQMRSLTGPKNPEGEADPIIVHPDVRRMLLTQKAFVEGNRAMIYWLAQLVDLSQYGDEESAREAEELLELLTPIAKAFCTETGQEVNNLGLQVFGGHGYISENGMEQVVRDGRISTVYEGTTGIQALDLLGRKVLGSGSRLLHHCSAMILDYCESLEGEDEMQEFREPLRAAVREWDELAATVVERAIGNLDELGAASVDFIHYSGYVVLAYIWARMAQVANRKLAGGESGSDADFHRAKLVTARFYYARLLPRAQAHAAAARAGAQTLMSLEEDGFAF
jgi:alkylation response protein AidB-like acyl-CoA dehydrogenase